MRYLFAAALVASTVAGFGSANAEGGCGPGFHRGPYGGCRPNREVVVVPGAVVVELIERGRRHRLGNRHRRKADPESE